MTELRRRTFLGMVAGAAVLPGPVSAQAAAAIHFVNRAEAMDPRTGRTGEARIIRVADLVFQSDPAGTALVTGDGRRWAPLGVPHIDHFGGNDAGDSTDAYAALCALGAPVIHLGQGTARLSRQLDLPADTLVRFDNLLMDFGAVTADAAFPDEACLLCEGPPRRPLPALADSPRAGAMALSLAATPDLRPGDWIELSDPRDGSFNGARRYYRAGERVRVRSVDGTRVALWDGLRAGYDRQQVDLYKFPDSSVVFQGGRLRIVAPPVVGSGLVLKRLRDVDISDLSATGGQEAAIQIRECQGVRGRRVETLSESNYGIGFWSCQDVSVAGVFAARRHAVTVTNGGCEVEIPNRFVYVTGQFTQTDTQNPTVGAFNLHGGSEHCGAEGDFAGGINFSGEASRFRGNVHARAGDETCLAAQELLGFNHDFTGMRFVCAPGVDPGRSHRGAVELSYNSSDDLTAHMVRGGTLLLDHTTWDCPDVSDILRWRNWGSTAEMSISMRGMRVLGGNKGKAPAIGRFRVEEGAALAHLDIAGLSVAGPAAWKGANGILRISGYRESGRVPGADLARSGDFLEKRVRFSQRPPKPPVVFAASGPAMQGRPARILDTDDNGFLLRVEPDREGAAAPDIHWFAVLEESAL